MEDIKIKYELEIISKAVVEGGFFSSIGLLNGESGRALFFLLLHYQNSKEMKWLEKFQASIQFCIDKINAGKINAPLSLAEGIPGVCIALQTARRFNLLDSDAVDTLYHLENIIVKEVLTTSNKIYSLLGYDYFYGLSGIGNYLIKFSSVKNKNIAISLIEKLIVENSIKSSIGITWRDSFHFGTHSYNLGVAHGVLSNIIFLAQSGSRFRRDGDVNISYIRSAVSWLLSKENDSQCLFRFPCTVGDNDEGHNSHNRLAWCYGELTIAVTLIHAYKATGENEYLKTAFRIALSTVDKKDLRFVSSSETGIFEGGLCHGIAGIAYLYQVVSRWFKKKELNDCYSFWRDSLYQRCLHKNFDSSAGFYKVTHVPERPPLIEPRIALLDGTIGGGLFLLSMINPDTEEVWSPIFLTDI